MSDATLKAPPKDTRQRRDSTLWVLGETDSIGNYYKLGASLGQPGQFGHAYRAVSVTDPTDEVAVKVVSKARFSSSKRRMQELLRSLRQEVEVMQNLDHPHIIKLRATYEDATSFYIVMELCTGGELFDRITEKGQYNEKDASVVIRSVLQAIAYMHERKIAHCDLKPDNFIFASRADDAPLKVIDFGMSKFVKPRKHLKRFCGTPYYVAREVIEGKYDESADLWSIGVVLFVVLHGYPPFYADPKKYGASADERVYHLITKGFSPVVKAGYGAHFPKAIPVSESARDLISRLLVHDTTKRLTAAEALEHPWVRGETASSEPISMSVVEGLRRFQGAGKLRQIVLQMMTSELSDAEIVDLKKSFEAMDANGDGSVSMEELAAAMKKTPAGKSMGQEELQRVMQAADTDGDGFLSYREVLATYVQRKLNHREERLWKSFCLLDTDGDGRITAEELSAVVGVGDAQRVAELIKEVDSDGDGSIDYNEFLHHWSEGNEDAVVDKDILAAAAAGDEDGKGAGSSSSSSSSS